MTLEASDTREKPRQIITPGDEHLTLNLYTVDFDFK